MSLDDHPCDTIIANFCLFLQSSFAPVRDANSEPRFTSGFNTTQGRWASPNDTSFRRDGIYLFCCIVIFNIVTMLVLIFYSICNMQKGICRIYFIFNVIMVFIIIFTVILIRILILRLIHII